MRDELDDWMAVIIDVAAGYVNPSERPVLLGGLAVHVRTRPSAADPSAAPLAAQLGGLFRGTQDIDLCVRSSEVASLERRLGTLGFTAVAGRARRFTRGNVRVDIMTPGIPFAGLALLENMSAEVTLLERDGPSAAPVASPLALVVTKSHAYSARRADRDLVDVARLALVDLDSAELPEGLARLLQEEPRLHEPFRDTRLAFCRGARGSEAFFIAYVEGLAGVDIERALTRTEEIRDVVELAVRRMFEQCELLDEDEPT